MEEVSEFEIETLRAELQQEKQMKEMLDQSSAELKATIEELEKRFDSIENEGNEWKTRYETQTEMNQQLEKQILMLQDKVEDARRNLKEAGKSPRDNRAFDDLADAYHKANDERKQYVLEINATKGNVGDIKARQRHMMITNQPPSGPVTARPNQGDSPKSYRSSDGNIPEDQRILDARYGPIKKTAGVKALPSLDMV
ncbi:coiled-coil domain-containing protein 169-like [Elysia marginata]|uniref:Coiled-coil domain-containing protein 169-like n=1 Tax=Elysia marginata TaxID=1093978 RepID=A0AAV4EU96_9GAST|nr:coiled-coil domain-containing protein 169-like [Elysia marginata]